MALFEYPRSYWPDGFHDVLPILLMKRQRYASSFKGLQPLCFGRADREGMLGDRGRPLTCGGLLDRRNADGNGILCNLFDDTRRDAAF